MTNYGKLAEKLRMRQEQERQEQERGERRSVAAQFYERVKIHVDQEIEKANAELQQRKLASIERLFLPSYRGKLCLSFGSELMCTVDLHARKGQITAILSGPPNAQEISRKEFVLGDYRPEQVAIEVVSGIMLGEFD